MELQHPDTDSGREIRPCLRLSTCTGLGGGKGVEDLLEFRAWI